MNIENVLKAIEMVKGLLKEDYIEVEDMYSGECRGGRIADIKDSIIKLNEIFENKCEFKLILGAKEKDFYSSRN
jgi:hypothetical protein